ncbi:hypothetical protein KOI40_13865 [Aestuariicella sp. G3-2]|uniref:hypothetical protein n=1 Tax=Pseudomaricurvus albidus TaxID=2842452 RepID=UPI001C0BB0FD|nr:hypothetical protein [Aestuariicella albida]MBU3070907.1 hypothetical protein [Aestuariicella albida]
MDSYAQKLTRLLLTHGDPQVAPAEVAMLNNKPMWLFKLDVESDMSGYEVVLSGYAQHVYQCELPSDEIGDLNSSLVKLRSMPYGFSEKRLKGSVSTYSVVAKGSFRIDYQIYNGRVVIFNIQPVSKLKKLRDATEQPGVYRVKRNSYGSWRVVGRTDQVTTAYAAVNGQSNNLAKAQWLMGSHISVEFGEGVQEFSLYHNPSIGGYGDTWESVQDKLGFTTPVTRQFSKVLEKTQKAGNQTEWVVHSQGGLIFTEGVRYLLNNHSSWALRHLTFNGINHKQQSSLLDKQKVAFHGNANNNWRSSRLLERAGIDVIAIRTHDYDLVTNIVGLNTISPRKLVGSVLYANHVLSGSVVQSPHTLMQTQQQWEQNMINGPGKGRNILQKGFHASGNTINRSVKVINNYLP